MWALGYTDCLIVKYNYTNVAVSIWSVKDSFHHDYLKIERRWRCKLPSLALAYLQYSWAHTGISESHICLLMKRSATCDIYFFYSSCLCPTSAGSCWHILGNCHNSEHLNFWGCCSPCQWLLPVTHGALEMPKLCPSCCFSAFLGYILRGSVRVVLAVVLIS